MKIILFLALISSTIYAQRTIECANGQCLPSFVPQLLLEKPFYTAIDVGNNTQNMEVSVPTGQTPRALRISLNNGDTPRDLSVNLSSTREGTNSADVYIVGDMFRNLSINLSGFNGTRGKDASEICAERVVAGNYGADIKSFFESRRSADPGISTTRCDRIDLGYMQTFAFTCDDTAYTYTPGTNPVIDVIRTRTKARCSGNLVRNVCARRKANILCRWRNYYHVKKWWRYQRRQGNIIRNVWTYRAIDPLLTWRLRNYGGNTSCRSWYGGVPPRLGDHRTGWDYYNYHYIRTDYAGDPGFDSEFNPLPGSYWQSYQTTAYANCASWWSHERTKVSAVVTYDENDTACDDVSHPQDPHGLIDWAYSGPAQEPEFGEENVQCAVGICPVNSTVSEFNRQLDTIRPEGGTDGSQQGSGLVFIYNAQNLISEATLGQAGAAGRADISGVPSVKYCYRKSDAQTHGSTSEYARNPTVSFRKYNWQALRVEGLGDAGTPPASSGKKVEVYKKLDSSVRHWIKEEVF